MENKKNIYPIAFSHVGITVFNLEKAIEFYHSVMGWYIIANPIEVNEEENTALSLIGVDLYGRGWKKFRFAHLSSSDGIGLEIFEFPVLNKEEKSKLNFFTTGVTHFCVQDPDIEGLVNRIVEAGGEQVSEIHTIRPGIKPYKMVYTKDPFGNIIEIYTHSYELQNTP